MKDYSKLLEVLQTETRILKIKNKNSNEKINELCEDINSITNYISEYYNIERDLSKLNIELEEDKSLELYNAYFILFVFGIDVSELLTKQYKEFITSKYIAPIVFCLLFTATAPLLCKFIAEATTSKDFKDLENRKSEVCKEYENVSYEEINDKRSLMKLRRDILSTQVTYNEENITNFDDVINICSDDYSNFQNNSTEDLELAYIDNEIKRMNSNNEKLNNKMLELINMYDNQVENAEYINDISSIDEDIKRVQDSINSNNKVIAMYKTLNPEKYENDGALCPKVIIYSNKS